MAVRAPAGSFMEDSATGMAYGVEVPRSFWMPKVADSAPPSSPMSATMGTSPLRGIALPVDEGHAKLEICSTVIGCSGAPETVKDGWKQSGMAFGQRMPTAHTASTSTLSTTAETISTLRKLRTRVWSSSTAS
jgi:hypothetical protein